LTTLDYELILMLDPQVEDDARDKVAGEAKAKLEAQGEIKHEANWGVRKMAFEIDKRGEADYRLFRFAGGKELLDDLNHSLRITDGVLRFRIFTVDEDSPTTVPPDTDQIMRRDEDDRDRGRGRGRDRGDRDDRGPRRPRPDSGGDDRPRPDAAPAPSAEPAPTPVAAADEPGT